MNSATARRPDERPAEGLGDVLDQLTIAHAEMLARHGPITDELTPRPLSPVVFDGEHARAGLAADQAPQAEKMPLSLELEAMRHEQISRLAYYVAAYEIAHGDPGHAPSMRELGRDHADLADGLRDQIETHWAGKTLDAEPRGYGDPADLSAYVDDATAAQVKASHDRSDPDGRDNGNEL